ncbi:hypothetical protein EJB05_55524 [Eragrostis curvula]|uniref:LUC7 related protein n=1 Tax=Eragrostis curvula TaxID=38414 RepID=A0A5J9SJG6_9POAL|nr:hypothetical protein EJB05_55524 [Eragrostis curvula]
MDAIRKQLDQLMGANRNGDVQEVSRKYYDRDVCRLYLAGLCPHDLFQLTKMDMGPCPKLHSLQLRKEYPSSPELFYLFCERVLICEPISDIPCCLVPADGLSWKLECLVATHGDDSEMDMTCLMGFALIWVYGITMLSLSLCHCDCIIIQMVRARDSAGQVHLVLSKEISTSGHMYIICCSYLFCLPEHHNRYEEAKAKGTDNYDRELEETIERLIVECERKIQRALKRLEEEDAKAAIAISVTEVTQTKEVMELSKQIRQKMKEIDAFDLEGNTEGKIRATEEVDKLKEQRAEEQAKMLLEAFNEDRISLMNSLQNATQSTAPAPAPPDARTQEMINEKLKKAEELGENGMIDEAQKLLDEAEALKKLSVRPQTVPDSAKMTTHVQITDQKLRLCDICGAFLSVYDSDRRLADHFGGKLHMGYMLIRERLSELQEEKNKKRKVDRAEYDRRSRERSREHERSSSRDRHRGDRGSSRDRDRDYDRRRSHDRYHDRERDRESGRSRSYDSRSHRRSRSPRDSSRDYDRYGRHDRRDRY